MTTNSFDASHLEVISENIKRIKNEISEAAIKSNRSPDDVRLMAVTKTVCPEYINFAIDNCGIDLIGENKVQEILEKYEQLPPDINWHMIGHLQRNKVKYIMCNYKLPKVRSVAR